jgi:hypothetical protein
VATLTSYHFERKDYNETNLGLGLEYHHSPDWRGGFGFYENSYYHRTYYAMALWMPLHHGNWHFGMAGSVVSGYEENPVFVPIPTISYEHGRAGLNLGVTPSFLGLQVKFRID